MYRKWVACYLVIALFLIATAPRVDAGLSPSVAIGMGPSERFQDMEKIRAVLERKAVEARLHDLGLSAAEIGERLAALSDRELHAAAMKLDQVKVGGNGEGLILGLLIIAVVIFVLLPLIGIKIWRA